MLPMLGTLSIMDGAPTTETRDPALPVKTLRRSEARSWVASGPPHASVVEPNQCFGLRAPPKDGDDEVERHVFDSEWIKEHKARHTSRIGQHLWHLVDR